VNPQFYRANRRANPPEPERALLFAVLSEAIETFQKCAFNQSPKRQALFREAEAWIWDERSDYLMSFKNICHLMGLDPTFLRRGWWNGEQNNRPERRSQSGRNAVAEKGSLRVSRDNRQCALGDLD
jgi:hypothetical protein